MCLDSIEVGSFPIYVEESADRMDEHVRKGSPYLFSALGKCTLCIVAVLYLSISASCFSRTNAPLRKPVWRGHRVFRMFKSWRSSKMPAQLIEYQYMDSFDSTRYNSDSDGAPKLNLLCLCLTSSIYPCISTFAPPNLYWRGVSTITEPKYYVDCLDGTAKALVIYPHHESEHIAKLSSSLVQYVRVVEWRVHILSSVLSRSQTTVSYIVILAPETKTVLVYFDFDLRRYGVLAKMLWERWVLRRRVEV